MCETICLRRSCRRESESFWSIRFPQVHPVTEDQEPYLGSTLELQTRSLAVICLKDRRQPFRKHLLDTIDARFDGFWSASQNHTDFSVRKIVVRKQQDGGFEIVREFLNLLFDKLGEFRSAR